MKQSLLFELKFSKTIDITFHTITKHDEDDL